jgi:hypothetical protein
MAASGYQVYDPVLGILTAIVPTVCKSEASPFRRVRVTVLDPSVVQVMTNGWPGVRFVEVVIAKKRYCGELMKDRGSRRFKSVHV